MAVRGVMTQITVYAEDATGDSLYNWQNYFPAGREIIISFNGVPVPLGFSDYYPFQSSPVQIARDNEVTDVTLSFPATDESVAFVEECLSQRHRISILFWRWSSVEGLEDPSSFNMLIGVVGHARQAQSTISRIDLIVTGYDQTTSADFPGRTIPSQIVSPLSIRRF